MHCTSKKIISAAKKILANIFWSTLAIIFIAIIVRILIEMMGVVAQIILVIVIWELLVE